MKLGDYSPDWVEVRVLDRAQGRVASRTSRCPTASPATTPTRSAGSPPGPIATPSLASLDAALNPDTKTKYTYFVAIPNGDGAHDFSKNLAEHERKLRKYGY